MSARIASDGEMTMRIRVGLVLLLVASVAMPARAPDIVEREVVLDGESAHAAAKLLGLNADEPADLQLAWNPLHVRRDCSGGAGEPPPGMQRCDDIIAPTNRVQYVPGPPAELRVTGKWQDESTASGPRYARLVVSSPGYESDEQAEGDWANLQSGPVASAQRSVDDDGGWQAEVWTDQGPPFLGVQLYPLWNGTRIASLIIDFDTHEEHEAKRRAYEACLASAQGQYAGGC